MKPTDMGPVKYCRGCSEWWPTSDFDKTSNYFRDGTMKRICRACDHERRGIADDGNKGETLFLFTMGETLKRIAARLGQPEKTIIKQLTRCGAIPSRRRERGYCAAELVG